MKTLFFSLLMISCFAERVVAENNFFDELKINIPQSTKVPYRLFPTFNMWTYLKLDTRTGRVWGVQYSLDKLQNSFEYSITTVELQERSDENIGRFTLYPTKNNWNYILLDQFNGATYILQWSFEKEHRLLCPINPLGNDTDL